MYSTNANRNLDTPMALVAAAYTSGEFFQLEKNALFGRSWLPLCAVAQLGAAGDFASANIGGWPLLAVRSGENGLRAFHNRCRHQGMLIVDQPQGNCTSLRCRYHGWTYGHDGRLLDAPAAVAPLDRSAAEHSLRAAAVTLRAGLVLVNPDPGAAAPGTDDDLFAVLAHALDTGKLTYCGAVTTELACNWKALLEQLWLPHVSRNDQVSDGLLLSVSRKGEGFIARQVTPRSFLRSRAVEYVFAPTLLAGAELLKCCKSAVARFEHDAVAWQAARATDQPVALDEHGFIDGLHQRLNGIYRQG